MKSFDIWLTTDRAARLEGYSERTIQRRIKSGYYSKALTRKKSKPNGGYYYEIHISALSEAAQSLVISNLSPVDNKKEVAPNRKPRADKGTSKVPAHIIYRAAAIITMAKTSSPNKLKKGFGYKEGYRFFLDICKEEKVKPVSYRRFIDLTKPFVDTEIQKYNNKGGIKFRNDHEMVLRHDYSIYEPMQFIQNDHSQFDVLCMHEGKIIRPWAAFHNSVGDRILSYPTIVERPDSFSLADNLSNFVLKYGLSQKPVIYKSDHGKAMKSRLMTKNEVKEIELKPFKLEEQHELVMKLMGIGLSHEKGLIQNLGLVETHSTVRLPRTKLIERQFGIGGTMEWFKDRTEYTGRKYEEKPERLEKLVKSRAIWTSEEMVDYVIAKVDELNRRAHAGIKSECSGKFAVPHTLNLDLKYFQESELVNKAFAGYIPQSMADVYRILNDAEWSKKQLGCELYSPLWRRKVFELCGWQSRALPSRETLAMLSMKAEIRTVHKYGILINNNAYINLKLQHYIGQKVVIRYSPDNLIKIREQSGKEVIFIKEIAVFELAKEKFICIAEPHPRTITGIHAEGYARTFIKARAEQNKEIIKAKKITSRIAEDNENITHRPTQIIQLNTAREIAAKEMKVVKQQAAEQKKAEKALKESFEKELSEIYGTPIKTELT